MSCCFFCAKIRWFSHDKNFSLKKDKISFVFLLMMATLNNPVWEALRTRQQDFNTGSSFVKYFPADVAPFIAMEKWDDSSTSILLQQIPRNRNFSVLIAEKIALPKALTIVFTTPLYQMVCNNLMGDDHHEVPIENLSKTHLPQMLALTAQTKPGPFFERTIEFGNYIGIVNNGELWAMAGERMKVPGYTEISAVCTKPEHLGKGFAATLITHAAKKIIQNNCIPFLHVRKDNTRAIKLYERLGFSINNEIFFAIFKME